MTESNVPPLSVDQGPKLWCPHASRCGGCPQIDLSQREQRRQKLSRVYGLLSDAHVTPLKGVHFHESAALNGYRNRIRLRVNEAGQISFFNEFKSTRCAVLSPALLSSFTFLLNSQEDLAGALSNCAHLELRTPDLDGLVPLLFSPKPNSCITQEEKHHIRGALPSPFVVAFFGDPLPTARYPLGQGLYQQVPFGSFMQVNFTVNEALIQEIVRTALAHRIRTVADVYCGSGNFLLPLLSAGLRGIGIENDHAAISALQNAATEQGLSGTFLHADALEWARSQSDSAPLDLLVLDPPRAGLKEAVGPLTELGSDHIALCSCNPKSLVTDLQRLVRLGYEVESCTLFDMFEHTNQVEALVWLQSSRNRERDRSSKTVIDAPLR
jgi:23S rRNA (uracil1939-C5)-methyltransferase